MPIKCHICQLPHVQPSDNCVSIYTSYKLNAINNVTTSTGKDPFILLAYVPEQIWLPHCTCMFHCISTGVYTQIWHYFTDKVITQQTTAASSWCNHICVSNKYAPQMSYICHKCQLHHGQIWNSYVHICTSYELIARKSMYTCIPHYWHMPLNKYAYHITDVCPTALLLLSPYRPHITAYIHKKINELLHFFTKLLQNMCQQQMCPSNAKYMPYAKITWHASMGQVFKLHMPQWTHWNQPWNQKCCTHTTVMSMAIMKTMQMPTTMMTMQHYYTDWVGHWPNQPKAGQSISKHATL